MSDEETLTIARLVEDNNQLRAELRAAVDALRKLKCEAHGWVVIADRETFGNTNIAVMTHWVENAETVLAAYNAKQPEDK